MLRRAFVLALPLLGCGASPGTVPARSSASNPARPPASSVAATPAAAPDLATPQRPVIDVRAARLVRLCRIWGKVRYLHPWVVGGTVDVDEALLAALPAALAAQNEEAEVEAVRTFLDALHDPATRVERTSPPAANAAARPKVETQTVDGVLVARVAVSDWPGVSAAAGRLKSEIAAAKSIVLDLRSQDRDRSWLSAMVVHALRDALPAHDAVGLSRRGVEHRGYRPQRGVTTGGYETLLTTSLPTAYPAAPGKHPSRIVFLTNEVSGVPDVAWAMQATGDGVIALQGTLSLDELAETESVPLGQGHVARLRRAETPGATPHADLELGAALPDAKVLEAAIAAAKRPAAPGRRAASPTSSERRVAWHPDLAYEDQPYPSRERRILALFRFWNVIELFYPYLHLMGDGWDDALVEFLPRFEAAANAREYADAITELAAKIPDGHVSVRGPSLNPRLRGSLPSLLVQVLEGQVVVTAVADDAVLKASGVTVGDVILAVDGVPISQRMDRLRGLIPAANETWRSFQCAQRALLGDPSTPLELTVRGRDEATRELVVPRTGTDVRRSGPVVRRLDETTGYVDLARLESAGVDAMFAALEGTTAAIFDMRGYPHGTAWSIAPRLNVNHARYSSQIFEPLVTHRDGKHSSLFLDDLPPTDKPIYRGKTVMLVDERTMSQAEMTGIFFAAANGTKFVGSQTSGSNGDVTTLVLPGGYVVAFSGHDVRHADGRQLQRVGLVPDVPVRPTLKGVREGRDEVLERAVEVLRAPRR